MRIGVLALHGDFAEHLAMLGSLATQRTADWGSVVAVEVKLPQQLDSLDGLILPGGESTTIGKLMVDYGLVEPLRARVRSGLAVFGTCAGAILLARDLGGSTQPRLGVMDLSIRRNAYGRQIQSFETDVAVSGIGGPPLRAVFIRAPAIVGCGPSVRVLASLPNGSIVAARQGRLLAAAFHPELTGDSRLHQYFLSMVEGQAA
ncbi:MAG TPA: pyridoxal 5'-phosphate synthase glutaminase subunit PdxT [Spirochaetia bacterium]|nr:pyridoxal 5'-phosphate synthase glutaminase subunit PdxT [Spirochaetia bacterium]